MKLHLGCGQKYLEGYLNIDKDVSVMADAYLDLNKHLCNFPPLFAEEIKCEKALEHLEISMLEFLEECYRMLKPNGLLHLEFPNAFFWRYRLRYLIGQARGSYWSPFHTKLLHPSWVKETAKVIGFGLVCEKKSGLWFLPKSWSEQNVVLKLRKFGG